MGYAAFQPVPGGSVTVSASTTPATTLIPSAPATGPWQCSIYNTTAVVAYVREGSTNASATADYPIPPGADRVVTFDSSQSVNIVLASGTGNVIVTPGSGY